MRRKNGLLNIALFLSLLEFFYVIIQESLKSIQPQDAANYNQSWAVGRWAQLGTTVVFC